MYLIKEMCDTLADRIELDAPHGEGRFVRERQAEQRELYRKHESDLYPGLFQDGSSPARSLVHGGRVYDRTDNVIRCVSCQWELEDIYECMQCGMEFGDLNEDDERDRDFLDAIGSLADALGFLHDGHMEQDYSDEEADEEEEEEEEDDTRPNAYDLDDSFVDDRPTSEIDLTQGDGMFFDEEDGDDDEDGDGDWEEDHSDAHGSDNQLEIGADPLEDVAALDRDEIVDLDTFGDDVSSSYPGPLDDEDMADYAFDQMEDAVPDDHSDNSRQSSRGGLGVRAVPVPAARSRGSARSATIYDLTIDSPEQQQHSRTRAHAAAAANATSPTVTRTSRPTRNRAPRIFLDSDDGE